MAGYLVQRSPTECGVIECDREAREMRRHKKKVSFNSVVRTVSGIFDQGK